MKITSYIFPTVLIVLGGGLLAIGAASGQNMWVMLGAGLALVAGVISLLLVMGVISRSVGMVLGVVFAIGAIFLAYRNYRSVKEVLEFTERKKRNDALVVQGLKDIRTAQQGYRDARGNYAGDIGTLRDFVRSGTIPMIRRVGQVPDTLTEAEAIELGIIVRDTIPAPALDSLFMTEKAREGRVYDFDPEKLGIQPVSGKPYLLRAGAIQSSGRNVPVFQAKDPTPMIAGDTLLVGSMEKATTSGNWPGQ